MKISGISDIIPDPNGVADLGDSSNRFGDVYMEDNRGIYLGNDGDNYIHYNGGNDFKIIVSNYLIHRIGSDNCIFTAALTGGTTVLINNASYSISYALNVNGATNSSGGYTANSDDRLKENESFITDAVATIQKIKPQIYDRKPSFTETDTSTWKRESGLIAQQVYYDAPELRHIITLGDDATPTESITIPEDPSIDPDYSSWGSQPAGLSYDSLIPYLIKSIQELKTTIDSQHTVINSQQTTINDLSARVQALEGN